MFVEIVKNDLYPEKINDKSLVIQMIEKGKRLYLLSKFFLQELSVRKKKRRNNLALQ